MGYVDEIVKYKFSDGESVSNYCRRTGASYTYARKLVLEGKSEKEIKNELSIRYKSNDNNAKSIDYLVYITKKKYLKAKTLEEISKIRDEFFSHSFGDNVLERGWDRIVLNSKLVVVDDVELWKPIKNSNYEISNFGNFRKLLKTTNSYKVIYPYPKQRRNKKGKVNRHTLVVKIKHIDGNYKAYSAAKLVATYFIANPKGYTITHLKNGNWKDIRASNITWVSKKQRGKLTGYSPKRSKRVALLDGDGNVIEIYRSARAAALDNYVSYQTVLDACHGRVRCSLINVRFFEESQRCMKSLSS